AAADCCPTEPVALTARADRTWRVDVPAAGVTAGDFQAPGVAGTPEVLRLGLERGKWRSRRHLGPQHDHAAVDRDRLPGDEPGTLAGEEDHHRREVAVGVAESPAERDHVLH